MNNSNIWKATPSPVAIIGKNGLDRTKKIREAISQVLSSAASEGFSRDELQAICKLRRSAFIRVLKQLVEEGTVMRTGTGVKCDPYLYRWVTEEQKAAYYPKKKSILLTS